MIDKMFSKDEAMSILKTIKSKYTITSNGNFFIIPMK